MPKYRKFTPEYRDEAVLMVIQSQRPIAHVARELGINEGTLGTWLSKYRSEHPVTEELSLPDRAKLKELERENRELRLMNDFLKKGSGLLRQGAAVSDKFALIAAEQANDHELVLPVGLMCHALHVSRSGFYDWARAEGATATTALADSLRPTRLSIDPTIRDPRAPRFVRSAMRAGPQRSRRVGARGRYS